jgi:hypothetical protein
MPPRRERPEMRLPVLRRASIEFTRWRVRVCGVIRQPQDGAVDAEVVHRDAEQILVRRIERTDAEHIAIGPDAGGAGEEFVAEAIGEERGAAGLAVEHDLRHRQDVRRVGESRRLAAHRTAGHRHIDIRRKRWPISRKDSRQRT